MKVLVDTSVWSLAFRRNVASDEPVVHELTELIKEVRVQIIGPIRQEILSGIKETTQFNKLKRSLSAFEDLDLITGDFIKAAEFFALNRKKGIQGSNTDFLICAVSDRLKIPIFTVDNDFKRFQQNMNLRIYEQPNRDSTSIK